MPSINRSAFRDVNSAARDADRALESAEKDLPKAAGRIAANITEKGAELVGPGVKFAGGALVLSHTGPATVDAAMGKDTILFNPHLATSDRILATGAFGLASAVAVYGMARGVVQAIDVLTSGTSKVD